MTTEQTQAKTITAEQHCIRGNEVLWLNDPQTIWLVQSGAIALFVVPLKEGIPEGERRYLFNATVNQALFGVAPCHPQEALALVGIALEPTELLKLTPSSIQLPDLIERWIAQFSRVSGLSQSRLKQRSPTLQSLQTQYISLLQGQCYQPSSDQIMWVQIRAGQASWLSHSELILTKETSIFPLGDGLWIEAVDHLELLIQPTLELSDSILLRGLEQFHTHCLSAIEFVSEQERQRELLRFQERQQLNQHVTQQTIRELIALVNPQRNDFTQSQTPLLIAAGAIAKVLGVTIVPPQASEDFNRVKEPLEAIARASQLRLRRVLLRDRWWQKDGAPMLAYTRMDRHPVALLPTSGSGYEGLNPIQASLANQNSSGRTSGRLEKFKVNETTAASLDPIAYVFYRPFPAGVLKAIDLLKFAFQGQKQEFIHILWTGIAATLLGMLIPQATAVLINHAIPTNNLSLLLQIGLGLLAAAFGGACFQLAQAIASMRLESLSDASLQAAVWDRLLKLKTHFFRQYAIGDLNARVSGISAIRRKLSGTTLQTLFAGLFSLLNLGLLFYYSSQLATLAFVFALIIILFTAITGALLVRQHRSLIELEGTLFGIVVQLINGISKLRIAGVEERAFAHWGQHYIQQLRLRLSSQYLEDVVDLFNTIVPALTTILLFWIASRLMMLGESGLGLSVGSFLAFNVTFGVFISGITSLSMTFTALLEVVPLWQRSQPILQAELEMTLDKVDPGRLTGGIRVDHVTFRYREDGGLILDDVSLQVQPGEFIALVGPSGSGKSTILRLLLGFETPISGTVYYDGQDLSGLDVAAVRRQLGVVLQNGRINAGSIFENIASGALLTLEEAWNAAENSGFADDVRAMPMQMYTIISEGGTNLSGGQRQRLLIARALALQPRILLFDEATSALDNRTQAIVSESLDRLQVTRVVIAHRLSTIRNAHRIYVLAAGRLVQQGSFDELVHQPGLFAQLISRQIA